MLAQFWTCCQVNRIVYVKGAMKKTDFIEYTNFYELKSLNSTVIQHNIAGLRIKEKIN